MIEMIQGYLPTFFTVYGVIAFFLRVYKWIEVLDSTGDCHES